MDQVALSPLPQPDFPTIANNLRGAAEHFDLCTNLPAVDGGNRILQRLDVMMQQMAALQQSTQNLERSMNQGFARLEKRMDRLENKMDGLEKRIDGLEQRMDNLELKVDVTNRNFTFRIFNSKVMLPGVPLQPLYSHLDGEFIAEFPASIEALQALPARVVTSLLEHLGENTNGTAAQKKQRLIWATGAVFRVESFA